MLMTFLAGLYDVYVLDSKLKTEKGKVKGDANLGIEG